MSLFAAFNTQANVIKELKQSLESQDYHKKEYAPNQLGTTQYQYNNKYLIVNIYEKKQTKSLQSMTMTLMIAPAKNQAITEVKKILNIINTPTSSRNKWLKDCLYPKETAYYSKDNKYNYKCFSTGVAITFIIRPND